MLKCHYKKTVLHINIQLGKWALGNPTFHTRFSRKDFQTNQNNLVFFLSCVEDLSFNPQTASSTLLLLSGHVGLCRYNHSTVVCSSCVKKLLVKYNNLKKCTILEIPHLHVLISSATANFHLLTADVALVVARMPEFYCTANLAWRIEKGKRCDSCPWWSPPAPPKIASIASKHQTRRGLLLCCLYL